MSAHDDVDARRGWRSVLVLVHVAFMLVNVSALVSTVRDRTQHVDWPATTEEFNAVWFMDTWGTFGRLSLLAVGIYLTALIARADVRVPKYYLWYGVALLAFDAFLNRAQHQLWDIPRGVVHTNWPYAVMHAAAMAGWVTYVSLSKKVRARFVHEPRALDPIDRLYVGLGATVLVFAPFILNGMMDATTVLAGLIAPRGTTWGLGFAQGIQATSTGIGLFVLLKHTFRMRNEWLAILLPVLFSILCVLYRAQEFSLHWTF